MDERVELVRVYKSRSEYIAAQLESGKSLKELAKEFGVTRERIRQLYEKELRRREKENGQKVYGNDYVIVKVKKLNKLAKTPIKAHEDDYCYDVYATSCEEVEPHIWKYGLGLAFEIKNTTNKRMSLDFRPRSSVWKTGLVLSNCAGTIDEGYRGEVSAYFYEVVEGKEKYKVGDRIGQIKIGITPKIIFEETEELSASERGDKGFGSSGKK